MPPTPRQPDSVTNIRRMIVQHRWAFMVPCFAVAIAVLVGARFLPRKYEGQAIFENRNDLVMTEIANRGAPQQFARLKRSIGEEVGGAAAIERAVIDLQLVPVLPPNAPAHLRQRADMKRQDIVNAIRRELRVSFDVSTAEVDRVRLTLISTDPELTRRVVNKLVDNYIERSRKQIDGMLDQAVTFFRSQVDTKRKELDGLEEERLKFEVKYAEILPDESGVSRGTLAEAQQQLLAVEQTLRSADLRVTALEREVGEDKDKDGKKPVSVTMQRNPELKRLQDELRGYNELIEKHTVIEKMTEQHPTVVTLRHKVEDLEREIAQTPAEIVAERVFTDDVRGPQANMTLALVQAKSDRDAAQANLKLAQEHVAKMLVRSTEVFPVRAEYRKLATAITEAQRQLDFWNDNLRRIQITLTAELGQRGISMEFLKPCGSITRPTSPDLMQVFFVAAALGIAFGTAWVVFAERTDVTFQSVDQAAGHLRVPVLGAVAEIVTAPVARWRRLSQCFLQPAGGMALFGARIIAGYTDYLSLRQPEIPTSSMTFAEEPDRAAPITSPTTTATAPTANNTTANNPTNITGTADAEPLHDPLPTHP